MDHYCVVDMLLVARSTQRLSGYGFRALASELSLPDFDLQTFASGLWLPGSGHKTNPEKAADKR